MHRLTTLLGMPQHRFVSIHVVGTNGKSSVTRMVAALLEAHGVSAGACVSPHAARWSERTLIHGREIGAADFAAAVERAAQAAEAVNRGLDEGEAVTQFELATAATFVAFASARVKAAAVEAGLGGRLDATNTIPSRVTVLTSVGLDHTQWLGETEEEIAAEKLAVLRDHSVLVLGRVRPAVAELAERTARKRGARLIVAAEDPGPEVRLRARGRFQRRNFALACAAAEVFLGGLDAGLAGEVAAEIEVPGRLEQVSTDPPAYLDAAHNPDAAAALAEALPELAGGRPVVCCLAILREKDVKAVVEGLRPVVDRVICSELREVPRAVAAKSGAVGATAERPTLTAGELASLCAEAGLKAEVEPDLALAVERGRELAGEVDGVLLVSGSHYALDTARHILGRLPGTS